MLENSARAELVSSNGESIGTVTLAETEQGVRVNIEVNGLEPGAHTLQALDSGGCEPPHFAAPGGETPLTLGDMQVGETGAASAHLVLSDVHLDSDGDDTLLNRPLVITSRGGLGARLACGVVESQS